MLKFLMIVGLCFWSASLHAYLYLDVSIIFKKGIDKELVLMNELHSQEKFLNNETLTLAMKNGLVFDFNLSFVQRDEDYGPPTHIEFNGTIKDGEGKMVAQFTKEALNLEDVRQLQSSNTEGQLIELILKPKLRP